MSVRLLRPDVTDNSIEEIKERKKRELQQTEAGGDTPTEPLEIEDGDHFEEVLANHDTVLVDFHAVWCGPCQMMAPAVNKLAADDGVVVAKVDVDQRKEIAQAWGVQGMPTLVVVENGEEAERAVGARSYDGLRDLVS